MEKNTIYQVQILEKIPLSWEYKEISFSEANNLL